MIDPITQTILDEEQFDALYEILTESPWDPNFWVGRMLKNVRNLDTTKFNKMVAASARRGHQAGIKQGMTVGTFKGLATAAVAAAIITIAYQGYKRFLSKAARACKDKSGDMKTSCMNKYRRDALKRQISYLEKGLPSCDKTMEVYDCRDRVKRRIKKAKIKLGEL